MATFSFDVVIVGASFGGVAAALAAAVDPQIRVVALEASHWIGGQATGQGLTRWDETAASLTETTGSPKSYRDLRDAIRAQYPPAIRSALGLRQQYFNPGFSDVGPPFTQGTSREGHPFAADPIVVQRVFKKMLADAGVTVKTGTAITRAEVQARTITSVTAGADTYTGRIFLDATDLGELLPLCGVKWVIGAESFADTGEDGAKAVAHPEWIQPLTVPIAVVWRDPSEMHRIPKPANYDALRAAQGFALDGRPNEDYSVMYDPAIENDTMFNYRQFTDAANFNDGRPGRTTLNCASNDYYAAAIPAHPPSAAADAQTIADARAVSIAFLYYLQTDAPRSDGNGYGYPNLAVDTETFGTADGTAPLPYIRESRRLADPYVRVVLNDINLEGHDGGVHPPPLNLGSPGPRARNFKDSCGIGQYGADVHKGFLTPATVPNIGTPWFGKETAPFQVPLGALLPRELDNLVASCKNIGTTHFTSGAYRVHPIEWAIGEAAGALAAYTLSARIQAPQVWTDDVHLAAYQRRLLERGTPIFWWDDVRFEDGAEAFAAIHLLGVRQILVGNGIDRTFSPNGDFPQADRDAIDQRLNRVLPWPAQQLKRYEAAIFICGQLNI